MAVSAETRTLFRNEVENNLKKIIMLFCNENGEMKDNRCVDLNELGDTLKQRSIAVNADVSENMASFLQCFGDIVFEEETVTFVVQKEDQQNLPPGKDKAQGAGGA